MATESQRIAFLMGYSEAWAKTTDGSIVWPKGATVGEVETGLQSFYYDSRNLVIPVSFALQIASDRLGGIESSEDINQNMPGVRKVWERCSERASKRY
jgi:hypothetical protein